MYTLAAADTLQGLAGTGSSITYTVFGMTLSSASGVETYQKLTQGVLSTSAATLYTVPGLTTAFIKSILLCNTTGSTVAGVQLFASGSAGTNQIVNISVPANGQAIIDDFGVSVFDSAGSFQIGGSSVFDAIAPANTTPGVAGTTGSAATAARRDHTHQACGGIASISAAVGPIANTETNVISALIPASMMQVGTTYRITLSGQSTQTGAVAANIRIRIGAANTSSDVLVVALTPTSGTSGTGTAFYIEFLVTIYTTGSNGSAAGGGMLIVPSTTTSLSSSLYNVVQISTAVTGINTTVQNYIHASFQSGQAANAATFYLAVIEVVKM